MDPALLKDKFVGCMLGTHVGDALGMPVEGYGYSTIEQKYGEIREMLDTRLGPGTYTDDTEMMIAVAESLAEKSGFNGQDMAQRFITNFHPERGYGGGTLRSLSILQSGVSWEESGKMVFHGGSFGNGSSMRIAPIGAFYHDKPDKLRSAAYWSSQITHAHMFGKEGAFLQAKAVSMAIHRDPEKGFDTKEFIEELIESISPETDIYTSKLNALKTLLDTPSDKKRVVEILGHDSTAPGSVPTAIYSFLTHHHDFEETVVYAVGLGGDTDTIGAMSGAISGGYHGKKGIPSRWLDRIENKEKGRDYIEKLAVMLWEVHRKV